MRQLKFSENKGSDFKTISDAESIFYHNCIIIIYIT